MGVKPMTDGAHSARLILDMKKRGFSARWLAKQLGVSYSSINKWVREERITEENAETVEALYSASLDMPSPRAPRRASLKHLTSETRQLIVKMSREDPNAARIAKTLNISERAIAVIQKKEGLHAPTLRGRSARMTRDDYDWVVAERIYAGRGADLDPSYPEIRQLFVWAERDGLSRPQLAEKIGRKAAIVEKWWREITDLKVSDA